MIYVLIIFSFFADNGETFRDECNLCTCFSGELTCTKRNCPESVLSPEYNASKCSLWRFLDPLE